MLQRFLMLWLILLSLSAFYWPRQWIAGFDPFVLTKSWGLLMPLIALAMFAIGCVLPRDEVRELTRRWPAVLGGTAVQYAAMPLLAWSVGTAMRLPPDLFAWVTDPVSGSPYCRHSDRSVHIRLHAHRDVVGPSLVAAAAINRSGSDAQRPHESH